MNESQNLRTIYSIIFSILVLQLFVTYSHQLQLPDNDPEYNSDLSLDSLHLNLSLDDEWQRTDRKVNSEESQYNNRRKRETTTEEYVPIPALVMNWLFKRRLSRKSFVVMANSMKEWISSEKSNVSEDPNHSYETSPSEDEVSDRPEVIIEEEITEKTRVKKKTNKTIVYRNPEFRALCEDPVFSSVDSSLDGSEIIVHKDHRFYVMENLRFGSGTLMASGVTKKLLPNFDSNGFTEMVTIKEGQMRGHIFAFYDSPQTSGWTPSGFTRLKHLNVFKKQVLSNLPEKGFSAVFHNRDIENPLLIGLKGKQVYYYRTNRKTFIKVKQTTYDKSVERFPPNITAAFSMPNGFVYMFRHNKYCVRELTYESKSKDSYCDIWLDTRIFLGCYGEYPPPYSVVKYYSKIDVNEDLEEFCSDLTINGITKSLNGLQTIVFRRDKYWTFNGFPDKPVVSSGSVITDKWKGFQPNADTLFIVQEGAHLRGDMFSFKDGTYTRWGRDGIAIEKDKEFKKLNAIFHNSDVLNPMAIAFDDNSVYYMTTNGKGLNVTNSEELSENEHKWPKGITAAILVNMDNIYLFKGKVYCLRKWMCNDIKTNCCHKWFDSKQLFKC